MNNNGTLDDTILLERLLAEMGENPVAIHDAEWELRGMQGEMVMAGYAV